MKKLGVTNPKKLFRNRMRFAGDASSMEDFPPVREKKGKKRLERWKEKD